MSIKCNEVPNPARSVQLGKAIRTVLLSATLLAPAFAAGADEAKPPLRLCADPTNLPFSSDEPGKPGLYLEIGQAVAQKLGRTVSYNWYKSYFGKRTVRETLLSKQCDAMVGLPLIDDFMGPAVIFSKPIAHEGYALVGARDRKLGGIDDLRGLRVAVQYQSTPQNVLALRDDIQKITVLSPEEGMTALDQGKVDVAFIWAPVAGWLNKTSYGDKYQIVSTEGDGLLWATAIGFAKTSGALRDEVDGVLPSLQGDISALFAKYGVPNGAAVKFGRADQATTSSVGATEPVTVGQTAAADKPVQTAATSGDAKGDATADAKAGREVFNGTCAHCHGPDAVQAERKIDLRLLKKRYADDMESTFWKTVHDGRPAKGMPAWKDVFSDDELRNVYAYLQSVQDTGGSN
ncbi:cytochrome C [Bradyrhizobium sp. UFLA03-84]|uniref:c-type cytochrome n=1 Tax=Bradyrhizobium sp. UFLA03-84 TaxID=418599 RepID=UPI000BADF47B|nr:transporter substrate-binding domain-containing protein [Bradyrhizobium sp. UFLA03-84]PAY09104.1 cytochrome C [Bradyrhizobium sp. UFLA03-84]